MVFTTINASALGRVNDAINKDLSRLLGSDDNLGAEAAAVVIEPYLAADEFFEMTITPDSALFASYNSINMDLLLDGVTLNTATKITVTTSTTVGSEKPLVKETTVAITEADHISTALEFSPVTGTEHSRTITIVGRAKAAITNIAVRTGSQLKVATITQPISTVSRRPFLPFGTFTSSFTAVESIISRLKTFDFTIDGINLDPKLDFTKSDVVIASPFAAFHNLTPGIGGVPHCFVNDAPVVTTSKLWAYNRQIKFAAKDLVLNRGAKIHVSCKAEDLVLDLGAKRDPAVDTPFTVYMSTEDSHDGYMVRHLDQVAPKPNPGPKPKKPSRLIIVILIAIVAIAVLGGLAIFAKKRKMLCFKEKSNTSNYLQVDDSAYRAPHNPQQQQQQEYYAQF